jgi:hypothetical protein
MSRARVGDRVFMSTPGWETLNGHKGVVASVHTGPFPYMVRGDDGAFRRYRADEVRVIAPRLNGVRIVFEPKQMGGLSKGRVRWLLYSIGPIRVRTCRGSRR